MPARTHVFVPAVLAAALILVACGGDDGTTAAASSPTQAPTEASDETDPCPSLEEGPGTAVAVNMPGFRSIEIDTTSVKAGPTTFTVTSPQGPAAHELVVLRTDLAPNKLPLTDDGTAADERAPGVVLLGKTDSSNTGCPTSLTLDLQKADYVLICNLPGPPGGMGHYETGMVAPPFTVT